MGLTSEEEGGHSTDPPSPFSREKATPPLGTHEAAGPDKTAGTERRRAGGDDSDQTAIEHACKCVCAASNRACAYAHLCGVPNPATPHPHDRNLEPSRAESCQLRVSPARLGPAVLVVQRNQPLRSGPQPPAALLLRRCRRHRRGARRGGGRFWVRRRQLP